MKQLIVLIVIVLLITSCSVIKKAPEPVIVPNPAPAPVQKQQPARVNIMNNDGFLIGFFVFGDSLYYKGIGGTEREAAQSLYDSMKPSESVTPFMDELYGIIKEAKAVKPEESTGTVEE